MTKEVSIFSDQGKSLMDIRTIKKEGDQLVIRGKLMGAWESTMYLPPDQFLRMLGMLLKWEIIWYCLCLPFYLLSRRKSREPTSL
jgi:hypothetical protein